MEHQLRHAIAPVTRCIHLTYLVPPGAPDAVVVRCSWAPPETQQWRPAPVTPLISETALRLASVEDWTQWRGGTVIERRAGGLERTVVFDPYPEAQTDGLVDIEFQVEVASLSGTVLAAGQCRVQADNRDVLYLEDWTEVMQTGAVTASAAQGTWSWRADLGPARATLGNALLGEDAGSVRLPQLTFPLNLRGTYALFVSTLTHTRTGISLRLSGDERWDTLGSPRPGQEVLWRWARMEHQHLIIRQPHTWTGYAKASLDYVKLVPLDEATLAALQEPSGGVRDKTVIAYWEPYSWAFCENVTETLQHRQPLTAFAEAQVDIVDTQLGRFGSKPNYETRLADPLIGSTIGDPVEGTPVPQTHNVGRMQQYTNTLDATIRYCRELGLGHHANFGASNCYVGTPLQSQISIEHPDWIREGAQTLRFELPQVRAYVLSLYREALEIGAEGISIDYCRYPETLDSAKTGSLMMRELRALADEFGAKRGRHVPICVRFPAHGVRLSANFDYRTWAREGLVDYLCPSNVQGRHHHFAIAPYLEAVRGTACKLLPCVDGLSWGLEMPGFFLWRVRQLYEAGVDGIYVYQADARLLGWPPDRRCMALLRSSEAVQRWWEEDARMRPQCSKGIYLRPPSDPAYGPGYQPWERVRIWLEGIALEEVELLLDGKLISRCSGPPYTLGSEDYVDDATIAPGQHTLLVRARDGEGWLEQEFTIAGPGS